MFGCFACGVFCIVVGFALSAQKETLIVLVITFQIMYL
jgi:hypothetical protein